MHKDWIKKNWVFQTLWRRPNYNAVYNLRTTSLLYLLPQVNKCHDNSNWKLQYALFQTRRKKWENWPINISESKPHCFPLMSQEHLVPISRAIFSWTVPWLNLPFYSWSRILLNQPDRNQIPGLTDHTYLTATSNTASCSPRSFKESIRMLTGTWIVNSHLG